MIRFRHTTAGLSHEGHVRKANEDSLALRDDAGVWIVADGMGGHENGRWASQTIVDAVAAVPAGSPPEAVAGAVHAANAEIFRTATERGSRMGSTVVALVVAGGRFTCFWAGDSRIYLLRGGRLYQLTRDHTQVQEMIDRGLLTPEEARHHPLGHVLARAVGVQAALELDAVADEVAARDVFLLCSDGLTGVVSDAEIAERLSQFDPRTVCGRLLDLVLARGAPDNVTMAAIACEEATALNLAPAMA